MPAETASHIAGFYRASDGSVTAIQAEDDDLLRRALADKYGVLWIDLVTTDDSKARVLRDVFGFHPLTIEDAVSPHVDPAKIDEFAGYVFIVVQAVGNYRQDTELTAIEVDFYLGPNYVVSCHREPVPAIDDFHARCTRNEGILKRDADWVLHGLLDGLVDEFLPIVNELDDTLDRLEEGVLESGDRRLLQQILLAKRNTLRVRRATTPQREIMNRLSRNEFQDLIRPEASVYFRDIYDHLVRVEAMVEGLRDLADGALQTYLSSVSNRLNETTRVLTAAAMVFLPLTVITGVYGMNFEQNVFPAFNSTWGFFAVIGLMLANSLLMLGYFRLRGWV
jgi:magnesium transporter